MAEVVNVPKVGPSQGGLTREHSSLSAPIKEPKKPIEKVELKGTVVSKRPSFLSRVRDTFIKEDIHDVGDFILWDIVVPTIGRTLNDIICGTANRIFLGTGYSNSNSNLYRERGVTYVKRTDYSSASRTVRSGSQTEQRRLPAQTQAQPRVNFGLNEIVFDNYEDASSVLERLVDYLDTYGSVSVDDYFDLIGKSSPYTTQKWGWTSLSSATIVNAAGGYFIKLPAPVIIKE